MATASSAVEVPEATFPDIRPGLGLNFNVASNYFESIGWKTCCRLIKAIDSVRRMKAFHYETNLETAQYLRDDDSTASFDTGPDADLESLENDLTIACNNAFRIVDFLWATCPIDLVEECSQSRGKPRFRKRKYISASRSDFKDTITFTLLNLPSDSNSSTNDEDISAKTTESSDQEPSDQGRGPGMDFVKDTDDLPSSSCPGDSAGGGEEALAQETLEKSVEPPSQKRSHEEAGLAPKEQEDPVNSDSDVPRPSKMRSRKECILLTKDLSKEMRGE